MDPNDNRPPIYVPQLEEELMEVPIEEKKESVPPPFFPFDDDAFLPLKKHSLN